MAERDLVRYTLRIERELFKKFRYISDYDGRSANREIEMYIRRRVKDFEQKNGPIDPEDLE